MINLKTEIQSLIGEKVTFKRIITNSIILYFKGNPGDSVVKSIWIDPAWRYEKSNKYVISSYDFPKEKGSNESEKKYEKRFNAICAKTNKLTNSRILSIQFDNVTNDICINFNNKQSLKTWASSSTDTMWTYRNMKKFLRIIGACNEITSKEIRKGTEKREK